MKLEIYKEQEEQEEVIRLRLRTAGETVKLCVVNSEGFVVRNNDLPMTRRQPDFVNR